MKVEITIDCNNDSFAVREVEEMKAVLEYIKDMIQTSELESFSFRDVAGNTIGRFEVYRNE